MSRLEIIISILLTISVLINVGVFAYARAAITRLLAVSEELGDLQEMVNSFAGHLQAVYELDSFYGDETLRALLEHAISFNEQMETFEYIYSLTDEQQEIDDDNEPSAEAEETQA
tara:strand:- start:797 stop:1141 length:345 start_codon:yes stop_codon:yes gene_type:complete